MPIWLQMARSYSNPDSVNYKLAYLREQMEQQLLNLGDLAYADQVQLAMLGETIIVGGYLRTELIAANSIVGDKIASNAITTRHIQADAIKADHMDVDKLSSIVADTGYLRVGDGAVTIDGENSRIQANHADGSYTRMSSEGLLRYVAGTNYSYNYLLYVGEVDIEITSTFMESVFITLPSEFIGTNYEVFVSIGSFVTPQHRFIDTIVVKGNAVSNNRILIGAGLSAAKAEPRFGMMEVPLSDPITDFFLTGDPYNLFNNGTVRVQYIVIA